MEVTTTGQKLRKESLIELTNLVSRNQAVSVFGLPGVGKTRFLTRWETEIKIENPKLVPFFMTAKTPPKYENQANQKTVFIIDESPTSLESLDQLKIEMPNSSFVISCSDLFRTVGIEKSKGWETLAKNVLCLQPFDFFDHRQFLTEIINETAFTLTKFQIEDTYKICGGHPFLTETFIRCAMQKSQSLNWEKFKEEALNLPELLEINKRIWKSLTEEERFLLLGSFRGEKIQKQEMSVLDRLEKKGVIRRAGGNLQIFSKIFENYIRKYGEMKIIPSGIVLDESGKRVFRDGDEITGLLTAGEYYLLEIFTRRPDQIISREEIKGLLNRKRGGEQLSDEALDQVIVRLRNKIEKDRHNPQKILTLRGRGFQFHP